MSAKDVDLDATKPRKTNYGMIIQSSSNSLCKDLLQQELKPERKVKLLGFKPEKIDVMRRDILEKEKDLPDQ